MSSQSKTSPAKHKCYAPGTTQSPCQNASSRTCIKDARMHGNENDFPAKPTASREEDSPTLAHDFEAYVESMTDRAKRNINKVVVAHRRTYLEAVIIDPWSTKQARRPKRRATPSSPPSTTPWVRPAGFTFKVLAADLRGAAGAPIRRAADAVDAV